MEGIRFILAKPIILSTMLMDFVATFFASANTMMPIVAKDILKVGEIGYGWLSSAQAIGSVAAGIIVSQVQTAPQTGSDLSDCRDHLRTCHRALWCQPRLSALPCWP